MQSITHLIWNRGAINQLPINFNTVRLGIKGGNGLSMLCLFWEDLLQNLNSNTKNLFFFFFLFLGANRSYSFCFESKGCPSIHGEWSYVTVSGFQNCCFSQRWIIRLFFSGSSFSLRVSFKSAVILWCEGWFIFGVIVHR